jgi:hypothetical protein
MTSKADQKWHCNLYLAPFNGSHSPYSEEAQAALWENLHGHHYLDI